MLAICYPPELVLEVFELTDVVCVCVCVCVFQISIGMLYASASNILQMINVVGLTDWFFYFFCSVSLLVLRYKQPKDLDVPFKVGIRNRTLQSDTGPQCSLQGKEFVIVHYNLTQDLNGPLKVGVRNRTITFDKGPQCSLQGRCSLSYDTSDDKGPQCPLSEGVRSCRV